MVLAPRKLHVSLFLQRAGRVLKVDVEVRRVTVQMERDDGSTSGTSGTCASKNPIGLKIMHPLFSPTASPRGEPMVPRRWTSSLPADPVLHAAVDDACLTPRG
ncbi:hypothetical protein BJX96DRAFT_158075 [Aspergillus floccosus]